MNKIILLPDGYNGDMVKCFSKPINSEGKLIKLQCAEPGKEYMFRWTTMQEIMQYNPDEEG